MVSSRQARTILIALAFVVVCAVLAVFYSRSKQPDWKQVNSSLGFSLSYPATWRQGEEQSLFSLVDTKSKVGDFRSYIRVSTSTQFAEGVTFDKLYDSEAGSDLTKLFTSKELTKRSIKKTGNLTVDSRNAFETAEQVTMPGSYYSDSVYVLDGQKIYDIHLTSATQEELDRETPVFRQILSTFQFQ